MNQETVRGSTTGTELVDIINDMSKKITLLQDDIVESILLKNESEAVSVYSMSFEEYMGLSYGARL